MSPNAGAFEPYGVVDAPGALEVTIRENAVARMKDHGIPPVSWTTVAAERGSGTGRCRPGWIWGAPSTTTITATAF